MRLIDAYAKLKSLNSNYFYTHDVAVYLDINLAHASKLLGRLAKTTQIIHVARGRWVFAETDRLALPGILVSPFPAYISLQSALYYHGLISQIPDTLYAVSLARTRVFKTLLGNVSVHHIQADFFFDFVETTDPLIKIATPEKALIDLLYLGDVRSKLFGALPEVEFPASFSRKKAENLIKKIPSERKKCLVSLRFKTLYQK
jgi:predicted transcriptional regulator of viral defense system